MEKEPLLSSPAATAAAAVIANANAAPSGAIELQTFLTRLTAILTLAAVALWANYEASKGFDIAIIKPAADPPAVRLFDLMFVSNGRANRILYGASQFVEQALYPDESYPRKPIDRVTLVMASHNLTESTALVRQRANDVTGDYFIYLSPRLMWATDTDTAVASALQRAIARLWLWPEGQCRAPEQLLEAIADHLAIKAGFPPSSHELARSPPEPNEVIWTAEFLHYCEARRSGFVARLNRGMRERWTEMTADEALGAPVRRVFAVYRSLTSQRMKSINSTTDLPRMRQTM